MVPEIEGDFIELDVFGFVLGTGKEGLFWEEIDENFWCISIVRPWLVRSYVSQSPDITLLEWFLTLMYWCSRVFVSQLRVNDQGCHVTRVPGIRIPHTST